MTEKTALARIYPNIFCYESHLSTPLSVHLITCHLSLTIHNSLRSFRYACNFFGCFGEDAALQIFCERRIQVSGSPDPVTHELVLIHTKYISTKWFSAVTIRTGCEASTASAKVRARRCH